MKRPALLSIALLSLPVAVLTTTVVIAAPNFELERRQQQVRPLPGKLDRVLMVNDNNPELITTEGILISTFPSKKTQNSSPETDKSNLSVPLNGRFDLFSHHVYAGHPDHLESTLWLAVLAQPLGNKPVQLTLLKGSTALSQATEAEQTAAPFLPLPTLMAETTSPIAAGPGSRVAGDLLRGTLASELPMHWEIQPSSPSTLVVLPIPVAGLDPLLNGRNLQMQFQSSGPISLATLAAYGNPKVAPPLSRWVELLKSGKLSAKEHRPTPRGSSGKIIYSRVSGVQLGSTWKATLTDPSSPVLKAVNTPISWPISSLEKGSLGTGQVQTAELEAFYQGTAWAAHGNYGVEYDLTLPIHNGYKQTKSFLLTLESPLKNDNNNASLDFRTSTTGPVMYRGLIEVSGLNSKTRQPMGRSRFHLVLRQGQKGPDLGLITLEPGETRNVRVRLIYPADATPPQVLTLLPVKQSKSTPDINP
ncbi:MAG: DUF3370 domain-containing protein [Prochlorococcaceae cyanobacterium ETNP18_MAG_17]|nr:DUF3370 domain-containing protein [Prochlorococcaceae cyanobacterium ETNP18_MAG_17]